MQIQIPKSVPPANGYQPHSLYRCKEINAQRRRPRRAYLPEPKQNGDIHEKALARNRMDRGHVSLRLFQRLRAPAQGFMLIIAREKR
jgi:hypothetical protein